MMVPNMQNARDMRWSYVPFAAWISELRGRDRQS